MPVYLAHGFRWQREGFTGIRVHAIVQNLEDMSVEYIQNEFSRETLLQNFRKIFPKLMQQLEDTRTGRTIHFLEQYDPDDELSENAVSQKFAFVADRVITMAVGASRGASELVSAARPDSSIVPTTTHSRTTSQPLSTVSKTSTSASSQTSSSPTPRNSPTALSLSIEDAMSSGPAVTPQQWEALAQLRDKLAEGEKIGWWVVYNGDPDRAFSDEDDDELDDEDSEQAEEEGARTPTQTEPHVNGVLGQPLPSLLPTDMKALPQPPEEKVPIGTAIPHPPPPPLEKPTPREDQTNVRPKSNGRSFVNPLSLRKKSSRANLQPPKNQDIPEPPKLKEINKKDGFRYKFFGRGDKKVN
ncbi:hypothetical protein LTS08_007892 [Lithohypha guttulata]|nr:hypothetical protein LTS08_007892 [Lithohypha guttulata]